MSEIERKHETPAEIVNCCRAACKEDCTCPPCPCNFECWTSAELALIAAGARKVDA